MRITIGDKTKEFMLLLGISDYPFSSKELSEKFRIAVRVVHPDIQTGVKDNTMTRRVIEAYKNLKNLAIDTSGEEAKFYQDEAEKDLFELTEICPECKGRRTRIIERYDGYCPDCMSPRNYFGMMFALGRLKGSGYQKVECKKCKGTGKFYDKICFNCNGTGKSKIRCKTCRGNGYIVSAVKVVPCEKCGGRGKIVLNPFNPVIPKGAVLMGGGK